MRCTSLLLTLAWPLAAQVETAPVRPLAVATPLVVLEMRGLAVMATQLRPTNLGSLFASKKGETLWRAAVDRFTANWQAAHGDDATFPAARDRVLGYAGRMRAIGLLEPETDQRQSEPSAIAVLFEPDGKTDLAALGRDFGRWINFERKMPTKETKIGDATMQAMGDELGQFAIGMLEDGRLAACGGAKAELLPAALGAARARFTTDQKAQPSDPLFSLRIDMPQALASQMRGDRTMRAVGFESLRQFELTLQPRGPRVQFEMNMGFAGERGLFAALFPEHEGIPDLFGWAPKSGLATKVGRFDLKALWHAAMRMSAENNDDEFAEAEAKAKEFLGIDVAKDLLPHLTDELLVWWNPRTAKDGDEPNRDLAVLAALRLTDGKAFGDALTKMLGKLGLEVQEVDGMLRTDRNFMSDWVNFAVRGNQFVVALADPGNQALDAFLAHQPQASELPREVTEIAKAMPPGCNGFGLLDIHTMLRDHVDLFLDNLSDMIFFGFPFVPNDGDTKAAFRAMAPVLAEHNLGRVVTLSGTKADRWVFRVLW